MNTDYNRLQATPEFVQSIENNPNRYGSSTAIQIFMIEDQLCKTIDDYYAVVETIQAYCDTFVKADSPKFFAESPTMAKIAYFNGLSTDDPLYFLDYAMRTSNDELPLFNVFTNKGNNNRMKVIHAIINTKDILRASVYLDGILAKTQKLLGFITEESEQ